MPVQYCPAPFEIRTSLLARPGRGWGSAGYTHKNGAATTEEIRLGGDNRWRRVYVLCFSNVASHFIRYKGAAFFLREADHDSARERAKNLAIGNAMLKGTVRA